MAALHTCNNDKELGRAGDRDGKEGAGPTNKGCGHQFVSRTLSGIVQCSYCGRIFNSSADKWLDDSESPDLLVDLKSDPIPGHVKPDAPVSPKLVPAAAAANLVGDGADKSGDYGPSDSNEGSPGGGDPND